MTRRRNLSFASGAAPRPAWLLVAAVGAVALATPAWAQEDDGEAAAEEATAAPEEAVQAAVLDPDGPGFSRVIDEYETIYAIQRKAYLIKGKWELSPMYNTLVGDRFVATENSLAAAGSIAYHISEQFALEAFGGYFAPTESETTQELLSQLDLETEAAKLTQLLWAAGLGVQWSPIYGKLQFAGTSLGNFAFYLGAGAAVGQTRVQCKGTQLLDQTQFGEGARCTQAGDEVAYEPETFRVMGTFSAGFRFRFNNWFGLKTEIRDYIFTSRVFRPGANEQGEEGIGTMSDSVRNNLYLQIGLSFLLGGEEN